jgi:hypothetical protein
MLQMKSHPLGNVFEAMMEKGQDQIPDEGGLPSKIIVMTVFPISVESTLADHGSQIL